MKQDANTGSLRQRIIRAGGWTLVGHALAQIIRLAGNLVMTRLLAPEMFGIMAIASVFIVGLAMFSDLGLRQVVVQNEKGGDPDFLNTVWSIQVLRGLFICLGGLLIAAALLTAGSHAWLPSGNTYAKPELPWVLGCLSFSIVVSGLESTKLLTANRDLQLGRITLIELVSQVAGLLVMSVWALLSKSIYALVAGTVVSVVAKTLMSHFCLPGQTNRFAWHPDAAKEIYGFGKWIFLTSIMGFVINSGDKALLGALLSAEMMGIYFIAAMLAGAAQEIVSKIIGNVVFPALGEALRLKPNEITSFYYRIRWPLDVFCLFSLGFLFLAGTPIVNILYDHRYADAGWMLETLALSLFFVRYNVATQLYLALGRPRILALSMVFRLTALALFIPAGYYLGGIKGVIWALIAAGIPEFLIILSVIKRRLGLLDLRKELRALALILPGLALGAAVRFLF